MSGEPTRLADASNQHAPRCCVAGCGCRPASTVGRGSGREGRRTAGRWADGSGSEATARVVTRPSGPFRPRVVCGPCLCERAPRRAWGLDRSRSEPALMRRPAPHSTTINPRSLIPSGSFPAARSDRDDLLHARRIRRIARTLVTRHLTLMKAGEGRRRTAPTSTVHEWARDSVRSSVGRRLTPPSSRRPAVCPRLGFRFVGRQQRGRDRRPRCRWSSLQAAGCP